MEGTERKFRKNADHDILMVERANELYYSFNQTDPQDNRKMEEILKKLLPYRGKNTTVLAPFYVDYGYNCLIGDETFISRNVYLMDCEKITIGKQCFIGANCKMYTAGCPSILQKKKMRSKSTEPITIGDKVWIGEDVTILPGAVIGSGSVIGAGVTILPGVTIGEGSIIGAKSVVTENIPDNVIAAGKPCGILES